EFAHIYQVNGPLEQVPSSSSHCLGSSLPLIRNTTTIQIFARQIIVTPDSIALLLLVIEISNGHGCKFRSNLCRKSPHALETLVYLECATQIHSSYPTQLPST